MPYHIKKVGKKFQIIRDADNVVVGTSDRKAKALRSIGYRMEAESKKKGHKAYKKVVDNKLDGGKSYGETDFTKKVIKINKKAHKAKGLKRINPNKNGTEKLISTIVHEEKHAKSPYMKEKNVRKFEKKAVARMSAKQKARKYSQYRTPIKVL